MIETAPRPSLRAGDLIGARYRVDLQVHLGRATARYIGFDTKAKTPVCIELVLAANEEADQIGVRFLSCARRVANLKTPSVVRVLDAGVTEQGHPYVVTEALSGETISKALELRGSAPTAEAIDATIDICEALAEAHANGLLHGDLSTDSVQIAPELKIVGIGTTHATLKLRGSDELGLRAPEQLDPEYPIDARADVWSVGVILYTMLAGASPFASDSPSNQNVSLALDEPPQLAGVPDALADVVDSCLAKNPVLRPHTIKGLAEELAPFSSHPAEAAARIAMWEECAPQSTPTLVAVVYEALRKEKEDAVLGDADSTAPRTALGREALRREGAVDISDPRLAATLDKEPSVRDVMKSEPPPAVALTLPPTHELPTVVTRRPTKWKLGMHPMTLVGASACIVVASVIAAGLIQRGPSTSEPAAANANVTQQAAPPPAPEPRESPPSPAAVVPATTATANVIAASALPEAPPPAVAPKRVLKKPAASAAAPADTQAPPAATVAATPAKPVTRQPATEPKADDDLRKFLDDRR